jgi:drug/metabolite transporter (DMT)-like permease
MPNGAGLALGIRHWSLIRDSGFVIRHWLERPSLPVDALRQLRIRHHGAFAIMATLAHSLRDTYDWQVIAVARAVLPTFFAVGLALAGGARLVVLGPRTLWIRSIAGSLSMVCMFYALTRLPISEVFTLNNMFPIWVALLSWPVLHERPGAQAWVAAASGVVGVVLIQEPRMAEGNPAALVALASSFLTAIAMLGLHRLQEIDPRAIVAHFSGVAVFFCGTAYFAFDRASPSPEMAASASLLLLVGLGVAATVGQLFLTKAFAAGPPAKVAVVGLTQVAFTMLFDCVLFGRVFSVTTLLGMALIVAPTAWLMLARAEKNDDGLPLDKAPPPG